MEKNPKCPKCNADKTVPIVYGFPGLEMLESYEKGEIMIGGCDIGPDSPKWHCKKCGHQWGFLLSKLN